MLCFLSIPPLRVHPTAALYTFTHIENHYTFNNKTHPGIVTSWDSNWNPGAIKSQGEDSDAEDGKTDMQTWHAWRNKQWIEEQTMGGQLCNFKGRLKLECMVALCCALLHTQLIEEKFWVKKLSTHDDMKHPEMHKRRIFYENKSCSKLPKLPRNHISREAGGPARQTDNGMKINIAEWQVESLLATYTQYMWTYRICQQAAVEDADKQDTQNPDDMHGHMIQIM